VPDRIPNKSDISRAADIIRPYINRTPVLTSTTFNRKFQSELYFKCENFQKAGAFKSRGAVHAILHLSGEERKKGVCTHSSGNHAQALARAASIAGIPAYIVMPDNAPAVKVKAVNDYGGKITFCKPTLEDREDTLKEVKEQTGAVEIHPYDNYDIITGQATATMELLEDVPELDMILCPVGGGGLLAGTALAARYFGRKEIQVIACEPEGADDAYRSFRKGEIIPSVKPDTIADGLLTSLGKRNFPVIRKYVTDIVTVSEQAIAEAMKLIYERMKIVIEPSSAVPLAAVIENKADIADRKTGIIISGGNVDLTKLPF
jgi:threonine dehydratase